MITSLKTPGKGFQHCIKYDFKPQTWYHVVISFVYNRWKTSEVFAYVNGELQSSGELAWEVNTNEKFDKCFLGSADTGDESRLFCGQIASVYLFNQVLNKNQVHAFYQLGPSYRNMFQFSSESDNVLTLDEKKYIYRVVLLKCCILGRTRSFEGIFGS